MNLSRRSFLGGALALMAVPVVAKYVPILPRIVGDGAYDDADGLNALFAGEPVEIVTDVAKVFDGSPNGSVQLFNGIFRVTRPITIKADECWIEGCKFIADGKMDWVLCLDWNKNVIKDVAIHAADADAGIYVRNSMPELWQYKSVPTPLRSP